jgi:hypothetical protein
VYDYLLAREPGKSEQALERILPLYETERLKGNAWRFYGIRHNAAQAEYWLYRQPDRAEEDARTLLANGEQKGAVKYIAVARRLLGEITAVSGDAMTAEERLLAARNRPGGAVEASVGGRGWPASRGGLTTRCRMPTRPTLPNNQPLSPPAVIVSVVVFLTPTCFQASITAFCSALLTPYRMLALRTVRLANAAKFAFCFRF